MKTLSNTALKKISGGQKIVIKNSIAIEGLSEDCMNAFFSNEANYKDMTIEKALDDFKTFCLNNFSHSQPIVQISIEEDILDIKLI